MTNVEILNYNSTAICCKCRWNGSKFHNKFDVKYCDGITCNFKTYHLGMSTKESEHLHRMCPNCGYEWLEKCA